MIAKPKQWVMLTTIALILLISQSACIADDWTASDVAVATSTVTTTPQPTSHSISIATTMPTKRPDETAEPIATATADDDWQKSLPRDAQGNIIGGATFPIVNYSSTMIAAPHGAPCPRVTRWTFKVIKMQSPLRSYGVSDDPCVVQNAVDDLMQVLPFYPAFNTPETFAETAKRYDSDPGLINGVEKTLRNSWLEAYQQGRQNYNRCDKPVYHLLNVGPRTPLIANNDGSVSGRVIQISLLRATHDVSPFTCQFVSYVDGTVKGQFAVTTDMIAGKTPARQVTFDLMWDARARHWVLYLVGGTPVEGYAAAVRGMWQRSKHS